MSEPERQDIIFQLTTKKAETEVKFTMPESENVDDLIQSLYDLIEKIRSCPINTHERPKLRKVRGMLIDKVRESWSKITDKVRVQLIKQKLYEDLGILLL